MGADHRYPVLDAHRSVGLVGQTHLPGLRMPGGIERGLDGAGELHHVGAELRAEVRAP